MQVTRSQPLGQQIAAALQRTIITGEHRPGEQYTEEGLAEQFSVSRGPIREAFRVLEGQHLIEKAGRSYTVIGLGSADFDEIYRLRLALEEVAWEYAFANPEPTIAALKKPLEDMRHATQERDPVAFAAADIDLHSAVVAASGKRRLITMWDQLRPSLRMILEVTNDLDRDLPTVLSKHEYLVDRLAAGDVDGLNKALREHLAHAREIVATGNSGGPESAG